MLSLQGKPRIFHFREYGCRLLPSFDKQVTKILFGLFCLRLGKLTYVQNTNNLRGDMATYYDFFFTNTIRNEPIISIPYIDAFGTGKIQLKIIHPGLLQVVYYLA